MVLGGRLMTNNGNSGNSGNNGNNGNNGDEGNVNDTEYYHCKEYFKLSSTIFNQIIL